MALGHTVQTKNRIRKQFQKGLQILLDTFHDTVLLYTQNIQVVNFSNICHSCGLRAGNTQLYFCASRSGIKPVCASGHYGDSVRYGDEYYFYFNVRACTNLTKRW